MEGARCVLCVLLLLRRGAARWLWAVTAAAAAQVEAPQEQAACAALARGAYCAWPCRHWLLLPLPAALCAVAAAAAWPAPQRSPLTATSGGSALQAVPLEAACRGNGCGGCLGVLQVVPQGACAARCWRDGEDVVAPPLPQGWLLQVRQPLGPLLLCLLGCRCRCYACRRCRHPGTSRFLGPCLSGHLHCLAQLLAPAGNPCLPRAPAAAAAGPPASSLGRAGAAPAGAGAGGCGARRAGPTRLLLLHPAGRGRTGIRGGAAAPEQPSPLHLVAGAWRSLGTSRLAGGRWGRAGLACLAYRQGLARTSQQPRGSQLPPEPAAGAAGRRPALQATMGDGTHGVGVRWDGARWAGLATGQGGCDVCSRSPMRQVLRRGAVRNDARAYLCQVPAPRQG